jgi:hypothetical protein
MRDVYVIGAYTTAMSFADLAREAYLGSHKALGETGE